MVLCRTEPVTKKRLDPGWDRKFLALSNSTKDEMYQTTMTAFDAVRVRISVDDLSRVVETGDAAAIEAAAQMDLASLGTQYMEQDIEQAMVAAADYEIGTIAVAEGYVFNPAAPSVREWMSSQATKMIVEIDQNTREGVRAVVADAIKTGRHPYDTARSIKESVGLHKRYAKAVDNYAAKLAAKGIPEAKAERMVAKYAERLRKLRAETIARTESMTALNRGRFEMRRQLIEDGVLPPDQKHKWRTATDERVCDVCGPLDGVEVVIGEKFGGEFESPPAHPMCRCIATLVR